MKGSSIFQLLFGIILFGLAYYFLKYRSEEGFQVSDLPYELSDMFLDNTLNPVVADFTSYGYNLDIIYNFLNFITNSNNYAKPKIYREIGYGISGGYWTLNTREFKNVSDTIMVYGPKQESKFRKNFNIWDSAGLSTKINPTNYLASNWYSVSNNNDINSGYKFVANYPGYSDFVINMTNPNLQKLRLYVYGTFCNYHSNDFQESIHWGSALNFSNITNIDSYLNIAHDDIYFNGSDVSYSYGSFYPELVSRGGAQAYLYDLNVANNLSNTIYKWLRNDRLNTIKRPSFSAPNNITITIPRYHPNGTTTNTIKNVAYYTIGLPQDVRYEDLQQLFVGKITPRILGKMPNIMRRYVTSWAYNRTQRTLDARLGDPNLRWYNDGTVYNIQKAAYLLTLATNNLQKAILDNNRLLAASWSNYLTKYLYTNMTATSNAGWCDNTAINEMQNRDCIPITMDGIGVLDSNSFSPNYNINILATVALFGKYNDATYGKATQVVYSKNLNRYWAGRGPISTTDPANTSHFYYTINTTAANPNHSYKTSGNTWDLNDNTIILMTSDFKANMSKLLPDYGMASTINILDNKMLDSIAQSFYEYSDGLFEVTNIYDLYLVGSNMMDIRFDKKQRLAPNTYINLRNQYIPQINEYNKLLDIYNNGTWVETYSNIKDLQSNISTSLKRLDPVLNPIYAVNNANPNTLRAQIDSLTTSNISLQREIDIATLTTASRISSFNATSNTQGLSDFLMSGTSAQELADLNSKLENNTNTINKLSQDIDGIETNVARVFFTMTSSSNLIINGIALGPNAALTYNLKYSGGLQLDMGQSLGNVNYSPTIIYTKNVIPNINPSNIDFIKQAAQLYMDGITTTLSSFTRNIYRNSNGSVRVDRVYGFSKLDDTTCGFTWQESQYDFYTNKPNVRRIVDVALKFAFDNIEYQNPQIYIDNNVSNIYLSSSNIASQYSQVNSANIQTYNTKIISLQNDIRSLQIFNSNIVDTLSNYLVSNIVGHQVFNRSMSYESNVFNPAYGNSFDSNFPNIRYKNYYMVELFNLTRRPFTFDNMKEYLLTTNTIPEGPTPSNVYSMPEPIDLSNFDNLNLTRPFVDSSLYPVWSNTIEYRRGNLVKFNSNYYIAKADNTNVRPNSTAITSVSRPDAEGPLYWAIGYPEISYAITNAFPTNTIKDRIDAMLLRNKTSSGGGYLYTNLANRGGWRPPNQTSMVYGNSYTEYLSIGTPDTRKVITNKILNYRLNLDNLYQTYNKNLYRINLKTTEISNINNAITGISNLDNNISNTYVNGAFKFGILVNSSNTPFTLVNYLTEYNTEVYYPPFESISNARVLNQYSNARTLLGSMPMPRAGSYWSGFRNVMDYVYRDNNLNEVLSAYGQDYVNIVLKTRALGVPNDTDLNILNTKMSNLNVSNAYIVIPWQPQEEETLDNNDGACPANMVCGNAQVMNQLMDSYNLDSNNNDKILRILKAFTPNAFQCDYSVEMTDSNRRIKKGTISFEVAQDIENCSYVISSNSGFNTGYYILDKIKNVKDSSTDISGYQYITTNLKDFANNVQSLISPLTTSAAASWRKMSNAVTNSRALTYTSLGKLNTISNIESCQNLNYDRLSNMFMNDENFLYSIFDAYPYVDSHINKILRFGITASNMIEIAFEKINLAVNSNIIVQTSRVTAGALYRIIEGTLGYCDYKAEFVRDSAPSITGSINYSNEYNGGLGYSRIYNDINILNPREILKVNPVSKKVIQTILYAVEQDRSIVHIDDSRKEASQQRRLHLHINRIQQYEFINPRTVAYTVFASAVSHPNDSFDRVSSNYNNPTYTSLTNDSMWLSYSRRQITNMKFLLLINFAKSSAYNVFNIDSMIFSPFNDNGNNNTSRYPVSITNRNTFPPTGYFTQVPNAITEIPNNFVLTNPIDFNSTYIKRLSGLPNIASFRVDPLNNNVCEYYLNLGNYPIERKYFKVTYYTDNWFVPSSSNVAIYSIVPATIENSLFNPNITGVDRNTLLNMFKSYYESKYTDATIANFHTVDSVINNNLTASMSIIYYDSMSNYDNSRTPSIKEFNNEKFFKIYYYQEPSSDWSEKLAYKVGSIVYYNSLYYTARFGNTNVIPNSTQLVRYGGNMVEQGQLYWGTGVVSDPTLNKLTVYTFTEVPRLSNATNFTYINSTSIPTKNYYLDNILWQYIRFTPILDNPAGRISDFTQASFRALDNMGRILPYTGPTYQLSQFELYKNNTKLNINTNELYSNIFNYNNVNVSNSSNVLYYEARYYDRNPIYYVFNGQNSRVTSYGPIFQNPINISFVQPTNFNGFSFTTGKTMSKNFPNWKIEASTDKSTWVTLMENSNVRYSRQPFYRTNVYNFIDDIPNYTLSQNPYYKLTLYECAAAIAGDSLLIRNLYNSYTLGNFNNDMTTAFSDYPKALRLQNLSLVYFYQDSENNIVYHILKTRNLRENTDVYFLYYLDSFIVENGCASLTSSEPTYLSNISPNVITKLNANNSNCSSWSSSNDCMFYTKFTQTTMTNVFTGTTSNIFNKAKFCSNYHENALLDIISEYVGGNESVRFDISYEIRYKKTDTATNSYSYIIDNLYYRKIYLLNDLDYYGKIYYTEEMPIDTIVNRYVTSNITIAASNLPYTNLGTYEIKMNLATSNDMLFECVTNTDDLTFLNSSNYTVNMINISSSNIVTYASINNFILLGTPIQDTIYNGLHMSNMETKFNPFNYVSNIKNNCGGPGGINYTNSNILELKEQVQVTDEDGGIYNINIKNRSIFNSDIVNTLSNTYNLNLNSDTDPYIAYGKEDSNDSFKYYYIVCIPGTDITTSSDRVVYAEYSIKFFYGSNSTRNYSNIAFYGNLEDPECNHLNRTITFLNLYTQTSVNTRITIGNYQEYGRVAQYTICSNYINTTYNGLNDFTTSPPSFYTKLLYTKDRTRLYFKKDFVYITYNLGNLKNPEIREYSVNINSIINCSNIDFTFDYRRNLTYNQLSNLPNEGYIQYYNFPALNTRQELSNSGITYSNILSNFGGYQTVYSQQYGNIFSQYMYYDPMNIDFYNLQNIYDSYMNQTFESYINLQNLDIDLENIESRTVAYTKYEYKNGVSIFSFLVALDGISKTLTDDAGSPLAVSPVIDYSIYVFYNSSNSTIPYCGIEINNSNIDTNLNTYSISNSYIENTIGIPESTRMRLYGLDARTPLFINTVNSALSNLRYNATYQNNIFTIQHIYTDSTNLQNKYLATYWPPDTLITLDGLIGTSPLGYLGYTITLSNILSSSNYSYSLNSIPEEYAADFATTGWSNGMTGKFYKNGVLTNTNIRELSYNATNCFNYYTATNSDIVSFLFSGLDVNQFSVTLNGDPVDLTEGTGLPLGIYAYKKTLSNFTYILHYRPGSINYYPIVQISLADSSDFTATSCTDFFTTFTSANGTSLVNLVYISGSIPSGTRSTYATTNGYTINYIANTPSGFQDYNPSESFADYHIRDPIKKKIETYTYFSLTATNNFRVNEFTLYTIRDSKLPTTLVKTDVNSIIVENPRNSVIVGYSFITNSISPIYDPKEWILKGTNDGRNWTTLDSKKLGKVLTRNYQLPLLYLNGRSKVLPQPVSRLEEKVVEQDYSIDKSMLVKYYKQRINPSIMPDYKKFMYDRNNKIHYFLHDTYDLNKNLVEKNVIIGFILQDNKVKKPILYENEDGTQVSFDLTKNHMKQFWEKNIMLPLVFQDF